MRILLPVILAATLAASDSDYQQFDGRAMLGINMTPPSAATQTSNGTDPGLGVEAQQVYPGTAAQRMGVQPGDLITTLNGGTIGSMNDLRNEVALAGVGGDVVLEVMRNGERLVLQEKLSEWPANIPYQPIDEAAERRFRDWQARRLDRTQQAVASLRKQVEDLERKTGDGAKSNAGQRGPVSPMQAMGLPASQALAALPAFKLTLRTAHDAADSGSVVPGRTTAWDARVLVGTSIPVIF